MEKSIAKKEGAALVQLARVSIAGKFKGESLGERQILNEISQELLNEKRGIFVTLHKKGKLRGCIGNIEPVENLGQCVRQNAVSAAFEDSRFTPLTQEELPLIDIEISILSKPERLAYKDSRELISFLIPGEDGVIIEKNHHRATFLPQVWEQLPTPEAFLTQLCIKAGLSEREWEKSGLILHTYQVQSFGEIDEGGLNS
jgi:AmmeMemoRadiSam system protein A